MDPISAASSALVSASAQFDAAGAAVVGAANSGGTGDLASAIVGQSEAASRVTASASVLKSTEKMFKALLDIIV